MKPRITAPTMENKLDALYPHLRYLIVESALPMVAALRNTLGGLGAEKIEVAASVSEALSLISHSGHSYDLIVCSQELEDARSGQQLLEELRHRKLLRYRSIFIMVAARVDHHTAALTAEWLPDAYLIKPFTPEALRKRVDQALQKRMLFGPIHDALEAADPLRALAQIDSRLKSPGPFEADLLRLKAELCIEEHHFAAAEQILSPIANRSHAPWALVGLARIARMQRHFEESEVLLRSVVHAEPRYLAAWDLLAQVQLEKGDLPHALATLEVALRYSERNVLRHRELGHLALLNRKLDRADLAYQAILRYGQNSALISASDFAAGSALAAVSGRMDEATRILREGEQVFPRNNILEAGSRVVSGRAAQQAGESEAAARILAGIVDLVEKNGLETIDIPVNAAIRSAAQLGNPELAERLSSTAIAHSYGSPRVIQLASAMMEDGGLENASERIQAIARNEIAAINNRAVEFARQGKLDEAVQLLLLIARRDTTTTIAQLNASQAILLYLEEHGWNPALARECRKLLDRVSLTDPELPKLHTLQEMMAVISERLDPAHQPKQRAQGG